METPTRFPPRRRGQPYGGPDRLLDAEERRSPSTTRSFRAGMAPNDDRQPSRARSMPAPPMAPSEPPRTFRIEARGEAYGVHMMAGMPASGTEADHANERRISGPDQVGNGARNRDHKSATVAHQTLLGLVLLAARNRERNRSADTLNVTPTIAMLSVSQQASAKWRIQCEIGRNGLPRKRREFQRAPMQTIEQHIRPAQPFAEEGQKRRYE